MKLVRLPSGEGGTRPDPAQADAHLAVGDAPPVLRLELRMVKCLSTPVGGGAQS